MITNYERPKKRPRTLTREMEPFWLSLAYRGHDSLDPELTAAEWGGFPDDLRNLLGRAGLTCQRQVEACPDFLLRSVPGVGPIHFAALRGLLPYNRAPFRVPHCPAKQLEEERWRIAHTRPRDNLHVVEVDVTAFDDAERVTLELSAWPDCECRRWACVDVSLPPSGHHPYCPTLLPRPEDPS